jgi:hypothetical protein
LFNRCFPEHQSILKNEPSFERDKCSVSWHADSTLEHFSSIAVYHCTDSQPCPNSQSALPTASGGAIDNSGQPSSAPPDESNKNDESTLKTHYSNVVPKLVQPTDSSAAMECGAFEEGGVDASWRIGVRVWYDAEGPNAAKAITSRAGEMPTAKIAPAVAVPLQNRSAYFLLDDFNHHHQHTG